jgi:hypothetical protein
MSEVQRLREKADRCHRLARTIFDEQMVKALREYAAEAEEEAAVLEAGYAGGWRSRRQVRSP